MSCKIAVDCDGVLADFNEAYISLLRKLYPEVHIPEDFKPSSWDYPINELGLTKEQYKASWKALHDTPNFWLTLRPMSGVGALATFLATHANEDIWIVTARCGSEGMTVAIQTQMWLNSCGIFSHLNYLGVITGANSDEKILIYKAMGMQYSIDDKAETVEQCDTLAGHKAYLLDQPWNQDAKVERRVKSVQEFLDEVGK